MTIGAEQGEIAEVGSPVHVVPDPVDTTSPWRWTSVSLATTAAFLALFNGNAVRGWFDELSPNAATELLRTPIASWSHATAPLDTPRRVMRHGWQAAQAARFGSERPGEQGQQGSADAP